MDTPDATVMDYSDLFTALWGSTYLTTAMITSASLTSEKSSSSLTQECPTGDQLRADMNEQQMAFCFD